MTDPFNRTPAERFAALVTAVKLTVARPAVFGAFLWPLLMLLCNRLNRAGQRVLAIAARLEAGTLRPPRKRRPAPPRPPQPDPAPAAATPAAAAPVRLPQGFGWVYWRVLRTGVEEVRCALANQRSGLETLLGQPDMQALIVAAPQVGRHIRPVCRMLGITLPPLLHRPRRPRPPKPEQLAKPAAKPAKPPKPPRPRPARPRTLAECGPPPRPGWERPVRFTLSPPLPRTPQKA